MKQEYATPTSRVREILVLHRSPSLRPFRERKIFVRRLKFEAFQQTFSGKIHRKMVYRRAGVPSSFLLCFIRSEVRSTTLEFSISDFQMPCGSRTRSGRISDRKAAFLRLNFMEFYNTSTNENGIFLFWLLCRYVCDIL